MEPLTIQIPQETYAPIVLSSNTLQIACPYNESELDAMAESLFKVCFNNRTTTSYANLLRFYTAYQEKITLELSNKIYVLFVLLLDDYEAVLGILSHCKFSESDHEVLQEMWFQAFHKQDSSQKQQNLQTREKTRIKKNYQPPFERRDTKRLSNTISSEVENMLNHYFLENSYPNREELEQLVLVTGVYITQLKKWFENLRGKYRKMLAQDKKRQLFYETFSF